MVGEQEVCQSQDQGCAPCHLKRENDVLVAEPEKSEERRRCGRDPRINTGASHHPSEQHGSGQVKEDCNQLVRHIGSQPEQSPQRSVNEYRERGPVLVVRAEEIAEIAGIAVSEVVPVIKEEPLAVSEHEKQHQCDTEDRDERENREPGTAIGSEVRGETVPRPSDRGGLSPPAGNRPGVLYSC